MQTLLQRVEVEAVGCGDHDLAVDDRSRRQVADQRLVQLGEVAIERLQLAALDVEVRVAAEHDGAKAVPLRLVEEPAAVRQHVRQLGEHRLDRRLDRKSR
jgi:hypothetical protein